MEPYEIPLGFGMALAQNPEELLKFAALPEHKKRKIINGTHTVSSKEEMRQYVERILTMM